MSIDPRASDLADPIKNDVHAAAVEIAEKHGAPFDLVGPLFIICGMMSFIDFDNPDERDARLMKLLVERIEENVPAFGTA